MINETDTRETYDDDRAPTNIGIGFSSLCVPQLSSSQHTESTIALSSSSQNVEENDDDVIFSTSIRVECQTNDAILLTQENMKNLSKNV